MGVNVTHALTSYSVNKLSSVQLNKVLQDRFEKRHSLESDPNDAPTVDIDVSWLMHKAGKLSAKGRISHIMKVCDVLCKLGNQVVLVCDGERRHDTKHATVSRQSVKYKNKVDLYLTRCEIVCNSNELQQTDSYEKNLICHVN
jgi:hypothetical protein